MTETITIDPLKGTSKVIVTIGASSFFSFEDLLAIDNKNAQFNKPNILWMQGASCSGCSLSMTNIEDISFMDFILNFVNLIYHPNISITSNKNIPKILEEVQNELDKNYILVVEGSIPTTLPHACLVADTPFIDLISTMSKHASSCIAVGTCATFGGVTNMRGAFTGASPLKKVLEEQHINKPLVNLPNCPIKPEHFIYTILYYIKFKKFPPLDTEARPKIFFSNIKSNKCSTCHFVLNDKLKFDETRKAHIIEKNKSEFFYMTGLFNRRYPYEVSQSLINLAKRNNEDIFFIMFDIDNFKSINDTYGHDVGDKVIISLLNEVLQKIRQSDIAARWGGEEFLILLPNTSQQGAMALAKKIRLAIEKLHVEEVNFTVSVGVTSFDIAEDKNIDDAIKKADNALYEAKNSGKNKVCLHI